LLYSVNNEKLEQAAMANNPLVQWASTHPRIAAWIVLALGMVALLVYFGREVGLTAFNWASLIVATVGVAGLCIWIISWEDAAEESAEVVAAKPEAVEEAKTAE
jgi:hypothetical protein